MEIGKARDKILLATLPHVTFDGWTRRSLDAGVAAAGLPREMAFRAFPRGMEDVIGHWSDYSDRRMREGMERLDLDAMRVRDRIATGVRLRIEANNPYRESVRRALSFLALPQNAAIAARNTYNTVNAIWYAAGDTSTDFNFYTKRGLLAPVYVSTVLYWLGDESEGCTATWAYLDRRIDDVMHIPKIQARVKDAIGAFVPSLNFRRRGRGRGLRRRRTT
jgi:ubiquinone biosynthesis protein COQ9